MSQKPKNIIIKKKKKKSKKKERIKGDVLRGLMVRLYPTYEQEVLLNKAIGSSRFVYNQCLAYKKESYENNKESKSLQDLALYFNKLRDSGDYNFLKEQNTKVIRSTLMNLGSAYTDFFRRVSKGEKSGYPNFKSKKNDDKVKFPRQAIAVNCIVDNRLNLTSFINNIKFSCSTKDNELLNKDKSKIRSVMITRTKTGKFFASILIDTKLKRNPEKPKNDIIGIDLGIKEFAVFSNNNESIENPKFIRNNEKKLKKAHRKFSKKQKISIKKDNIKNNINQGKNREKYRIKLAKTYEKINFKKSNFLHELSSKLINENQVTVIEDLSVKNMMKNHKLAKAIQEVSWFEFKRQLTYKAEFYKRTLVIIDRWFPSSKTCSCCGWKNEKLKLEDRTFICKECGMKMDRDKNAAINIEKEGKRLLNEYISLYKIIIKKKLFSVKKLNAVGISSPELDNLSLVDSAMSGIMKSIIDGSYVDNTMKTQKKSLGQKQENVKPLQKTLCKKS